MKTATPQAPDSGEPLFSRPDKCALEARYDAQRIAFGPVVFQAARTLRDEGILARLFAKREAGATLDALREGTALSEYALTVLLETALSADIVRKKGDAWCITLTGYFLERDELTRVNFDFVEDVCYRALDHLGTALKEARPAGLKELGKWPTVYEGLSQLPEPARKSWFAFDHFYSDSAFPAALEILTSEKVTSLADVGANTGRFSTAFLERNPGANVTLVDLPGQLALARDNFAKLDAKIASRATFHPCDLLNDAAPLPKGVDSFWMSQFLCCFSEPQVASILTRAAAAMKSGGAIYVLDTFWDRQKHEVAAYCLINTSPYFTAVANGNSRMYKATDLVAIAGRAGLRLERAWDDLGWSHTLLKLVK